MLRSGSGHFKDKRGIVYSYDSSVFTNALHQLEYGFSRATSDIQDGVPEACIQRIDGHDAER